LEPDAFGIGESLGVEKTADVEMNVLSCPFPNVSLLKTYDDEPLLVELNIVLRSVMLFCLVSH
jgi:hypothetical protein